MRKRRIFIAVAAFVAALLCSCSKERQPLPPSFKAVAEEFEAPSSSKTSLGPVSGGYEVNWADGDRVSVNGALYEARSASGTSAELAYLSGGTPVPVYKACYPYDISAYSGGTMSVTLPSEQAEPSSGLVALFPMYAESSDGTLAFKNLCGLVRLSLQTLSGSLRVSSITLECPSASLCGECSIAADGSGAWKAVPASGTAPVTLRCDKTVGSSAAVDFFLAVPQGSYNPLKITICTSLGNIVKTSNKAVEVGRSRVATISLLKLEAPYAAVDLGLGSGLLWAAKNVGASSEADIADATKCEWASASASSWGGGWRLPARADIAELSEGTYMDWTEDYNSTSVKGYIVYKTKLDSDKGKKNDPSISSNYSSSSDAHIFLPAAYGSPQKNQAYYWSSEAVDASRAYSLYFNGTSDFQLAHERDKTYYACVRLVVVP